VDDALAHDDIGDTLTRIYRVAEETRFDDAPLTAALVALWHADQLLMASTATGNAGNFPVE
jgi:hypothetical protein